MTSTYVLDARRRAEDLAATRGGELLDVLVIGGGVTGTGVALDAASRGLSVALVDKTDLAAGTSRWSSKLAHGGLRYIAAGQLGVAWESMVERNHLLRTIAPHLVQPMRFVIPSLPSNGIGDRMLGRIGFGLGDVMRAAARTPAALPATRWVGAAEARSLAPALRADVSGGFLHVDGALEDDVRLVVAIARTAAAYGARIITHCAAVDVTAHGATVEDTLTGERIDVDARCVIAATGVWTGGLVDGVPVQPSKGAHVLLPAAALGFPTAAFNILVPGSRNRFVFAVPRPDGTVQVGLTDDVVDGVVDEPEVTEDDERFLLETLSSGLETELTSGDVIGRFAGLRPLLGHARGSSAADLSRRHALLDRGGVLVIVGGKLTTYRRMAQDAVDLAMRRLGRDDACRTTTLPLVGAVGNISSTTANVPDRLLRRFGCEAAQVAAAGPVEPIAADLPMLKCEADWAVQAEGAVTAADVERRLRLDLVPAWRDAAQGYVEDVVARSC
ncbi:MAG TPA: glycerol-3-phosphate dehydrogenase/oxidase [Mycobacteriales bacterium]|nr:glycerol-3-phosphate dehydrogenase/oxidase [Mycobacteriales bacterium]